MQDYTTHYFRSASSYTVSISFDWRLYRQDISGSVAHARMLGRQGIISDHDASAIIEGLQQVLQEIEAGIFPWRQEYEDLHMNVEARLHELIGEPARRLHTARSRNDQVATATRLYVRDSIDAILRKMRRLQGILLDLSESSGGTLMPGYTHLQRAQPILLSHHLLAYVEMLERDVSRLREARTRTDVLPLGSGALAGVPYPIDREGIAHELGFDRISSNSLDAVADRDYVIEFVAAAAVCMMHTSRLAEELVLWATAEFGFVTFGEQWVTGSSIMPQKRNPDFVELARGKAGRVYGNLMTLLTVLKGLPLAYNTDLQEDKEPLFDTVDTLEATLDVFCELLPTAQFQAHRMEAAAKDSTMLATDLADHLVRQGVAFREAHAAVSGLIDLAAQQGVDLRDLPLEDYQRFSPAFDDDVLEITARSSAEARNVPGGTAPAQVAAALQRWRRTIQDHS